MLSPFQHRPWARLRLRRFILCCGLWLLTAAALAQSPAAAEPPLDTAVRAARWQVAQIDGSNGQEHYLRVWEQAAFWIGMTVLADTPGAPADIGEAVFKMGRHHQWQPGDLPFFADDHAITQAYLWAARQPAGDADLVPTLATFNKVLAEQPRVSLAFYLPKAGYGKAECLVRWCWCDALFMAPPALFELARQSGDPRYREHALREWWATTDFLYDPVEKLYYRDSRFFERRDEFERKLFWSRGNGWVFAGIARSLPLLEADSEDAARMRALFVEMAERLIELQKDDGYWPPSLLAPEGSSPETSGTGFFTYGLAWGINAGLLDRARFEPALRKGWQALLRALGPDGRLGYVQQISDRPEQVNLDDTQYYGIGALLLAASEITRLDAAVR